MTSDADAARPQHHPPSNCPICGERLALTRLSCEACETELAGWFEPCEFCALDADDRALLREFLVSRGNVKALQRQLDVSYPTARARLAALLRRLGLEVGTDEEGEPADERVEVLEALARGEIDVEVAERRLETNHADDGED